MDVLELAEEEAGEVEMVHGILEEPVAHVEPVRERPHRPRERAHRQRAELGLRRDLPREAVGAREPLHVSDDDGYARFRGFRREVGGLGRVVCRRLVGEHGDPLADARPDHARELVGWDHDDGAVERDLVEHPLRVVERRSGPESRGSGLRSVEVARAGRREDHPGGGEIRQDRRRGVHADADRPDAKGLRGSLGQSFSYALSTEAVPRSRVLCSK